MPYSRTKILYKPEPTHTSNHNQELADTFIHKMTILKIRCQQNICYTQEHMAEQANHHQNPAPNYQVRDIIWLNIWNIYNDQHFTHKLNMKANELFWIIQKININAYKLELPFYWKIYNVFNIICIQQIYNDSLLNQQCLISFKFNSDKEFEMKEILDSDIYDKHFI